MTNSFEEVNRARCFNHTLQLSAKTLLKPFNAGMSSTNPASEEDLEEYEDLDNEVRTFLDKDVISIDEADDDEDGDEGQYDSSREDLDGDDKPDDADSTETDELNQLDEQEREKVLADTAVVRQTVTKVCSDVL
jgi:hypothetical protein